MLQTATAWAICTLGLTLVFGRVAAYNLGNYRPVNSDEVELMSVGYKLATQGVLGSDLFSGFFGADQHYLMTLPLQHGLEAIAFRLGGAGIAQARWVSLLAGVTTIWIVGWLAYRWYGLGTAIVCEVLLVAWPSALAATESGLPLWSVARIARYDAVAVALIWLSIALLDVTLRRRQPVAGFALGVCCGLACLSTFLGTFVVPLVVVSWLWARRRRALAESTPYWIAFGAAVVLVPWLVHAARFAGDLAGQLTVYGADRADFSRPGFYLTNLVTEPARWIAGGSPYVSALLVFGILPAVAYLVWRCWRSEAIGDHLLLFSLLTFGGMLVLFDQTKTPLYAIVLLPSVCLALAVLWTGSVGWLWRRGHRTWQRLAIGAASAGLLIGIGLDGVHAYQATLEKADRAGYYLGVGEQLESGLEPRGTVLGPERWWWALHEHPYFSLRSLWFQWITAAGRGQSPQFADWVAWSGADNIVVNDNVRDDVRAFPAALQQQFWTFLDQCATRTLDLDEPTYLRIEVYRVTRPLSTC